MDDIGPAAARKARVRERGASAIVQRLGRVLLVEDEPDVAELVRLNLVREGYEVVVAGNGKDALSRAREAQPDVILLDVILPGMDGWDVCRQLRQDPGARTIPVIMVTARVDEGDRVRGFELGADDYVTKPFSPRELVARVRAVLRRSQAAEVAGKRHYLRSGDLEIDRQRFEVRMKGRAIELTPKEFELLATLVGSPGRVFGREELLDLVWGRDGFVEPRTVDVHVARLRAKFVVAKLQPPGIETVRGVGYRLRDRA
jgi:DNA-binding response OmpR family regulator